MEQTELQPLKRTLRGLNKRNSKTTGQHIDGKAKRTVNDPKQTLEKLSRPVEIRFLGCPVCSTIELLLTGRGSRGELSRGSLRRGPSATGWSTGSACHGYGRWPRWSTRALASGGPHRYPRIAGLIRAPFCGGIPGHAQVTADGLAAYGLWFDKRCSGLRKIAQAQFQRLSVVTV